MAWLVLPRRDEWLPSVPLLMALVGLQALMVYKFHTLFSHPTAESWVRFMRNFRMSGFDPTTYSVVLHWHQGYDVLRHPLLAYMVWPLSALNHALSALTGQNCVQYVVGAVLVACAYASLLLMWRTLRFVMGTGRWTGWLLTVLFMSFAYIVVAMTVSDHFCFSLPLLMLTLYLSGRKMRLGRRFSSWQAIALFVAVAGVTLSNGIVVLMAVALTNGRHAMRPRFMAGTLLLPALLMLGMAMGQRMTAAEGAAARAAVEQQWKWTHHDLSRTDVVVENLLGESLQLHRSHILGDVLSGRPVIVRYTWPEQYGVEALLVLLAVAGAWLGRAQRMQWLLMGVLAFNVVLHVALGFALDEVHIMAAHWAFVLPLSMGWLLCASAPRRLRLACAACVSALALYLCLYHGVLLFRYLTWPLA